MIYFERLYYTSCAGSAITQLAGTDPDSVNLTFSVVVDGNDVTLLRIQQLSPTSASVILNRQLNAAVSARLFGACESAKVSLGASSRRLKIDLRPETRERGDN